MFIVHTDSYGSYGPFRSSRAAENWGTEHFDRLAREAWYTVEVLPLPSAPTVAGGGGSRAGHATRPSRPASRGKRL